MQGVLSTHMFTRNFQLVEKLVDSYLSSPSLFFAASNGTANLRAFLRHLPHIAENEVWCSLQCSSWASVSIFGQTNCATYKWAALFPARVRVVIDSPLPPVGREMGWGEDFAAAWKFCSHYRLKPRLKHNMLYALVVCVLFLPQS